MANVRQYIGARYVTKVYENSLDPSSAEWESGVTYEPLTMVTYNNSSYLSKKDVPGSVGDPAANPSYWVVTGAYNGQILALDNRLTVVEGEVAGLSNLNVKTPYDYGAVGDGITNDLQAFIDMNAANSVMFIPAGTYYFASRWEQSGNNKLIIFDPDAVITCGDNSAAVIKILGDNVIIKNIHIKGNKSDSPADETEFNHGLYLRNPKNVLIESAYIEDVCGDGIYIGNDPGSSDIGHDVILDKCYIDGAGRNGLSIISNSNFVIRNCTIINTALHNPQMAIDIEPDADNAVINGLIDGLYSSSNANGCIGITLSHIINQLELNINNVRSVKDSTQVTGRPIFYVKNLYTSGNNTGIVSFDNIHIQNGRINAFDFVGMTSYFPAKVRNLTLDQCQAPTLFNIESTGATGAPGYIDIDFTLNNRGYGNTKFCKVHNSGSNYVKHVKFNARTLYNLATAAENDIDANAEIYYQDVYAQESGASFNPEYIMLPTA